MKERPYKNRLLIEEDDEDEEEEENYNLSDD